MYCSQCGSEIPPQAKFCGGCGKLVAATARTSVSESLDRLRFNSATSRLGSRAENQGSRHSEPQLDNEVRCLFVVGATQTTEAINWLKSKYPKSYVIKFSTIGAIRETVLRYARDQEINHLCLIGTADSVPPHKISLSNSQHGLGSDHVEFYELESDVFYCSESFNISTVPDIREDSTRSMFYRHSVKRSITADTLGIIPVGRIPFDDFSTWKNYLLEIESVSSTEIPDWIAIASQENLDWGKECEVVLQNLNKKGNLYVVPHDWERLLSDQESRGFKPGSRVQVNLHGEPPKSDHLKSQLFGSKAPPGEYTTFDLSDAKPYPNNIMFLYACYGGNSGWWHTGFIPEFFRGGGCALIASSTSVWCSSHFEEYAPNLPPGAVEICAEFFKSLDSGLTLGDALTVAKATTLSNSLEVAGGLDFCKTLKEVCQFSLFGAPWFTPNKSVSATNKSEGSKRVGSLLDSIRSGSRINRSGINSSSILSQVRERLHKSLGSGAEYFTLSRQSVIDAYRNVGVLEKISNSVRSAGFEFESSNFESLELNGIQLQIAISPSSNKDSSVELMSVIDGQGQILKTYKSKG